MSDLRDEAVAVAREATSLCAGDQCCGSASLGCDDKYHHQATAAQRQALRARLAALTGEGA